MTHYEVLGVTRGASAREIRQAYVRLAREHHPDRHAASAPATRDAADRRMRSINDAWHTLGDPERRRRYDEGLDRGPSTAEIDDEPVRAWQPFDDGWDDEPDERLDDSLARRPTGGRLLALVPALLASAGAGLLVVGLVVGLRPLLAAGAAGLALGVLGFLAAPLAVVLESRRHDRL